jgi:hypothetical protein
MTYPGDTPRENPSRYDATAWARREPAILNKTASRSGWQPQHH